MLPIWCYVQLDLVPPPRPFTYINRRRYASCMDNVRLRDVHGLPCVCSDTFPVIIDDTTPSAAELPPWRKPFFNICECAHMFATV
jgi:hypothetical protein